MATTKNLQLQLQLKSAHIALCDLLKVTGLAASGGRGKAMVAEGLVSVDGQPEHRKTAKIRAGQVVECQGYSITVLAGSNTEQAAATIPETNQHQTSNS